MFKYALDDEYNGRSFLNEMLISQMCKFIGLPCQEAKLARYTHGNVEGVKIRSFLKEGEREVSMNDILKEKCDSLLVESFGKNFLEYYIYPYIPKTQKEVAALRKKNLHTSAGIEAVDGKFPTQISLEDIELDSQNKIRLLFDIYVERESPAANKLFGEKVINAICNRIFLINRINTDYNELQSIESLTNLAQEYASVHGYTLAQNLEEQLAQMLIFDFVVAQTDRHLGNISLILSGNTLRLAPLFDNGHCLVLKRHFVVHDKLNYYRTKITPELLKKPITLKTIANLDDFLNVQYDNFVAHLLKNAPELLELAPHYKENFEKSVNGRLKKYTTHSNDSFATDEDGINAILNGNIEWLANNGIEYTPELWLKTYLFASKQLMRDHIDELKYMYHKVNDNRFADLFQR